MASPRASAIPGSPSASRPVQLVGVPVVDQSVVGDPAPQGQGHGPTAAFAAAPTRLRLVTIHTTLTSAAVVGLTAILAVWVGTLIAAVLIAIVLVVLGQAL
jgi:hypothetical protein